MNTQHTPGPWQTVPDNMGGFDVWGADDFWVANMRSRAMPVQQANAKLIAAAPELLAALQEALDFINIAEPRFPKSIKHPDCFKLNLVRAAVSQAIHDATK
jgi:hypothetical protein